MNQVDRFFVQTSTALTGADRCSTTTLVAIIHGAPCIRLEGFSTREPSLLESIDAPFVPLSADPKDSLSRLASSHRRNRLVWGVIAVLACLLVAIFSYSIGKTAEPEVIAGAIHWKINSVNSDGVLVLVNVPGKESSKIVVRVGQKLPNGEMVRGVDAKKQWVYLTQGVLAISSRRESSE